MSEQGSGGPATWETVRRFALALPGVEEGTSYGTPAFRVKGKLFTRLREDGDSLVLKLNGYNVALLLETDPETFYVTDHYRGYPIVLARLSVIRPTQLRELLEEAWRLAAPKRLVPQYDQQPPPPS